jgi:hypothetical protein
VTNYQLDNQILDPGLTSRQVPGSMQPLSSEYRRQNGRSLNALNHFHPVWRLRVNIGVLVTCIPIARQRLGKHIPAKHTRATEGRPLLGNGPVNTSH